MCEVLYSTAVQRIKQNTTPFKTSISPHFFADARKGCVDSVYRKKTNLLGSRSYSPSSCYVEFLVIKLLVPRHSLTSVYPHSSHSLVPSDFDGLFKPAWLQRNSDRPQYVRRKRIACTSFGKECFSLPSTKKRSRLGYHPAPKRKSPHKATLLHPPRSRQARRQPVVPPGSNTRVCLDLV